ncbi:MAG: threonine synthase [Planctomycetota bacterium]|nr:MAG: threonine synthase [Planctomycetota bacterium]
MAAAGASEQSLPTSLHPAAAACRSTQWVVVRNARRSDDCGEVRVNEAETSSAIVCAECGAPGSEGQASCPRCGGLFEIRHRLPEIEPAALRERFAERRTGRGPLATSGVWRYRELVAPALPREAIVTQGEGNTFLYESEALGRWAGLDGPVWLKHEGHNPTGSFKDRGMTVGVSRARELGAAAVACASTGNTSSSLASYAARADMKALVFVPAGKVSAGKLAQTIALGARVLEVEGSFDTAMRLVLAATERLPIYLLNSVNPWRIEGQKTIVFELLEQLDWQPPDAIALPAGNLGNTSAFGKALDEAVRLGLIDRLPRLLPVQAAGAAPFHRLVASDAERLEPEPRPETVATAIRIGEPRSWRKARRAVERTAGRTTAVSDEQILEAKAAIDAAGIGCEPASAASLAGVRALVRSGELAPDARVVCVLTGHLLKDPDAITRYHCGPEPGPHANPPVRLPAEPEAVAAWLAKELG